MRRTEFHGKAELYHKYRWDYNPLAIDFIMKQAGLGRNSVLVDMGAGTGILTKHFADRVGRVYAVEPDDDMFRLLAEGVEGIIPLQRYSHFLPEIEDRSVDALIAAHAIHWFDYEATIGEWSRIAGENCLLFAVSNRNVTDHPLFSETGKILERFRKESVRDRLDYHHFESYFSGRRVNEVSFDFLSETDRETYVGSLASISFTPSPQDGNYEEFTCACGEHFLKHAGGDGKVPTRVKTIVNWGPLGRVDPRGNET